MVKYTINIFVIYYGTYIKERDAAVHSYAAIDDISHVLVARAGVVVSPAL